MDKQVQLMEFIVQDIIVLIVEKKQTEFDQAMRLFYGSETFDRLQDIDTGLYMESSWYIYDLFQDELEVGKLIQKEI